MAASRGEFAPIVLRRNSSSHRLTGSWNCRSVGSRSRRIPARRAHHQEARHDGDDDGRRDARGHQLDDEHERG